MTYIFLIAGKGSRLNPITLSYPKTLFKLDDKVTVIERMVHLIQKYDQNAQIIAVTGFMNKKVEALLPQKIVCIYNPFYAVTNSLASLWMARDYIKDDVVFINGDIVMSEELVRDVVCKAVTRPCVLLDSNIKKDGDYNVQVHHDRVVVMSKNLENYCGEYAGVVKLTASSVQSYLEELEEMIGDGLYNQWYEDVLVQMIFKNNFSLYYEDIANYEWTEIDCVSDLTIAKKIQSSGV